MRQLQLIAHGEPSDVIELNTVSGVMPRALRVQGKDHDALMMVKKFR